MRPPHMTYEAVFYFLPDLQADLMNQGMTFSEKLALMRNPEKEKRVSF